MNPIFQPPINYVLRHAMRPFARFIPSALHPRVHGTFRVRLGPGQSFQLSVNPTSYLGKVLFFQGVEGYEWKVVRIFRHLAETSRLFLDVGANIGYYSLVAATANPQIRVVSFEPLPGAFHYLQKNLALNGFTNATASPLALSDRAGTTQFFVSRDPAFAALEHHLTTTGGFNRALSSRTRLVESFDVRTETMDHFAASHLAGETIDLVKLDTESSEHLVLAGGSRVLAEHRPTIFCEVLPDTIEHELEAIFKGHGYRLFRAEADGLVETPHLAHGDRAYKEHVMAHPDRLGALAPFVRGS